MTTQTAIPKLGYLLRVLVKAAGYRGFIESKKLDKDLDDLVIEARPTVASDLLHAIEEACSDELEIDCGTDWAHLFRDALFRTRDSIQWLAQGVDTSPFPLKQGRELFFQLFTVPMLAEFLRLCITKRPGPDIESWWQSPFRSWVVFAVSKADLTEDALLTQLANDLGKRPAITY